VVLHAVEEEMVLAESVFLEKDSTGIGDTGGGGGVATLWRFVCALVLLAPILFCWLDWGASASLLLVLANSPVCCVRNKNS